MDKTEDKICLIIPCYNEEKRLKLEAFINTPENISFVFVNDGSTDGTLELLEEKAKNNSRFHVINLERNSGKAEAVRQGILQSMDIECDWIGFWDADLSTPLNEISNFMICKDTYMPEAKAILGCRINKLGSNIKRSYVRHVIGRLIATFLGATVKVHAYDSQCGAKIFRKELLEKAFGAPFGTKWLFDVEIILRLKGEKLLECPLREWINVGGSKILSAKAISQVLGDLARITLKSGK
jgi:glycosyltransferase involved in cell wall biosynthesis